MSALDRELLVMRGFCSSTHDESCVDEAQAELAELRQQRDEMLAALESVIEWDKKRRFLLPYRVRDPVHAVLFKVKGEKS